MLLLLILKYWPLGIPNSWFATTKTTAHRSDTGGVAAAPAAAAQWAAFTVPVNIALHHVLLLNDLIHLLVFCIIQK